MKKKQRRLLVSIGALVLALKALGTGDATAAPFSCTNINPFCWPECDCSMGGHCGAECGTCNWGVHEVWCDDMQ
jgi:hypothetical protein